MYIREAVEPDLPAIVAIYNAAIPCQIVTADIEPISVESRLAWFHQHLPSQYPLWVMQAEAEIAGWLGFQQFYSKRQAYQSTAELSLYVAPVYQRQGIGQALLQAAIARSPSLGLKTLVGLIFAENQPSLRLFEKFGFQQWGYLPEIAEFGSISRDLVIVGRKVPPPDQP